MIKINFSDFWPGFEDNNLLMKFLERHFPVVIDDKPDYLFYSVYGSKHFQKDNCIKILFTGENLVPDFNLCDYALGFHYMDFGDRYMRFPLYVYYQWYYHSLYPDGVPIQDSVDIARRKFCNFVYSNNVNSDPIRDAFFYELSKYKKVDSGGRHLNNIGFPVKDKLTFIRDYKFTIAFENSMVPGYTTEKMLEPIIAASLPVYFGNPVVNLDFDPESFIWLEDKNDLRNVINEIIRLDTNDVEYLKILRRYKFKEDNNPDKWEEKLKLFVANIFEQPKSSAYRRSAYGFSKFYLGNATLMSQLLSRRNRRNSIKAGIKNIFYSIIPKRDKYYK